ncbi:MAG: hybrid sensor histidine kinase/response regulator [Nitrospinae bacterium CG11_big_fil_rev_8_21_14_0_20_56_8]|nr:MAG: hybrid sensor histidine kinase/response regulator [Nitrospinae bacterium CG11_big_fil_rev_8_21_14_0_20_56_8]
MPDSDLNEESLSKMRRRIDYLEKVARQNLFVLDRLASLGELQYSASMARDPDQIINISREHLGRLTQFRAFSFFMVNEEDSEFVLTHVEPESERHAIQSEVDVQIDNGTFAWALNQNRPVVVKSIQEGHTLILHVLSSKSRVRGMFAALLGMKKNEVDDTLLYTMSVILQNTANALESAALYKLIVDHNQRLEETVRLRTKELEDQASSLREEIIARQLVEESLVIAKEEAEAAARAKSEFLANMSHEIRTPLNAILGYGEILQYECKKLNLNEFLDDLKSIESAGRHLLSLINDVLDISKIQAGRMDFHFETFRVIDLVDDVISTIRIHASKNDNALEVFYEGLLDTMVSDPARVRQILINLLGNACKFTHGGSITLKVSRKMDGDLDCIYFSVADTGIGIHPDKIDSLFHEFSQGDSSTTRKYGGTGLGLVISRRLSEMLGGDILVRSQHQMGSTFTLWLPVDGAMTREGRKQAVRKSLEDQHIFLHRGESGGVASSTPAKALKQEEEKDRRESVVVIDSDPLVCDLVRRFLEKEGVRVETATRGDEGIKWVQKIQPDLIVLDVMLAELEGWQTLERLKADPHVSSIPVVVLTLLDEKEKALSEGASEFLNKPLDWDKFLSIFKKYRKSRIASSILLVEDDPANRDTLTRLLSRQGWKVRTAINGNAALEEIKHSAPGVLLIDLMMPSMDGFELIDILGADEKYSSIPIIVLTAKELNTEDLARLRPRVSSILQKGVYTRNELFQALRNTGR